MKLYKQVKKTSPAYKTAAWWADFSVNGQRFRISTDTDNKTDAGKLAKDKESQAMQGKLSATSQSFARLTFLEAAAKYQRIKHGEAVGYGMIAAARISSSLQKLAEPERARIESAVGSISRLPALNGVNSKAILNALHHDKKVRDGAVHFILPREVGKVEITPNVPLDLLRDVVKGMLDECKRVSRPG